MIKFLKILFRCRLMSVFNLKHEVNFKFALFGKNAPYLRSCRYLINYVEKWNKCEKNLVLPPFSTGFLGLQIWICTNNKGLKHKQNTANASFNVLRSLLFKVWLDWAYPRQERDRNFTYRLYLLAKTILSKGFAKTSRHTFNILFELSD